MYLSQPAPAPLPKSYGVITINKTTKCSLLLTGGAMIEEWVSKEAKSAHVIIEQRTGKKPLVVDILIKCLFPYDFLRDLSICQGYFSP